LFVSFYFEIFYVDFGVVVVDDVYVIIVIDVLMVVTIVLCIILNRKQNIKNENGNFQKASFFLSPRSFV
jgi:hypothetical protein